MNIKDNSVWSVIKLRCEYLINPLGIDETRPRLSWENSYSGRNGKQTAYQVTVYHLPLGSDHKEIIWDSGKVESDKSAHIVYEGSSLRSYQYCIWKVKIWHNQSNINNNWRESELAFWSMGVLDSQDWSGEWIGYPNPSIASSPYFRHSFNLKKKVKKAFLYCTAKGLYEASINGENITEDIFTPGWTDYNKRLYYNTYDVSSFLKEGENVIGAILGEGWYKGVIGLFGHKNLYGEGIYFLTNLRVEYMDGSVESITSGKDWKTIIGPILQSSFLFGENYDATQELDGWNDIGYKDDRWQSVKAFDLDYRFWDAEQFPKQTKKSVLQAYPTEPVKRTGLIHAKSCTRLPSGGFIIDFEQNFAGRVRLTLQEKKGTIIRLRHGEMIDDDGSLYVENLRTASSTDTYVCNGKGKEVFEPRFTYHGFRFVEIMGLTKKVDLKNVLGVVIGSDTKPVGNFSCSSKILNQLYSNIIWTQRSNFVEVPTDCPQRDERLGWTGDAQMYMRTASYNMDISGFFTKWLRDLKDTQRTNGCVDNVAPKAFLDTNGDAGWGDAITICPMNMYEIYGDLRALETYYPAMKLWVKYLEKTSDDYLRGSTLSYGDWLSHDAETPKDLIQNVYYYYSVSIVAKSADILNKKSDYKRYSELARLIKDAFCGKFVKKDGKLAGHTQTAYVLALYFNLLSEKNKLKAIAYLVQDIKKRKYHLSTGFVGTPYIMHVLEENGYEEIAYRLLNNTTYPSWGYSVVNGATTVWERWNGWTKERGFEDPYMNSFSHYAYGAVGEWLFEKTAGIDMSSPGFKCITIKPIIGGGLSHAEASYESIYGMIRSEWKISGDNFTLMAAIPANTTATIGIPSSNSQHIYEKNINIKEVDDIDIVERDSRYTTVKVGSGEFVFKSII